MLKKTPMTIILTSIYMNYIIYINVKKQHGKDGFINALAVLRDYIASLTKKIN